jgi:hypothetical protein
MRNLFLDLNLEEINRLKLNNNKKLQNSGLITSKLNIVDFNSFIFEENNTLFIPDNLNDYGKYFLKDNYINILNKPNDLHIDNEIKILKSELNKDKKFFTPNIQYSLRHLASLLNFILEKIEPDQIVYSGNSTLVNIFKSLSLKNKSKVYEFKDFLNVNYENNIKTSNYSLIALLEDFTNNNQKIRKSNFIILDVERILVAKSLKGIPRYMTEIVDELTSRNYDIALHCSRREILIDQGFKYIKKTNQPIISSPFSKHNLENFLGIIPEDSIFHSLNRPLPKKLYLGKIRSLITIQDTIHLNKKLAPHAAQRKTIFNLAKSSSEIADGIIFPSIYSFLEFGTKFKLTKFNFITYLGINHLNSHNSFAEDERESKHTHISALLQNETRKNSKNTLKVLSKLIKKNENIEVDIFLSGGFKVKKKFKHAKFNIIENPSDEQFSNSLLKSDIFFFGSIKEGYGLPPLESIVNNAIPVVVETSSLPELLGDLAVYSKSGKVKDLINALNFAIKNRIKLLKNLENFNPVLWSDTADYTLDAYETVLNTNKDIIKINGKKIK